MKCDYCGKEVQNGLTVCDGCGAGLTVSDKENKTLSASAVKIPEPEMNWFKFLIYFSLYAYFVSSLIDAFLCFFGEKFGFLSEFIVEIIFTGRFRFIGIIYAVIILIMAAAAIYVRNSLAKFKEFAPKYFIIWSISTSVISLLFTLLNITLIENSGFGDCMGEVLGTAVGETIYVMCNVTYFKKRKHLFVNK